MTSKNILLYADSEKCSNMYYFGQFFVPDPFLAFKIKNKKIAVLSKLEFSRAKKESSFDQILPLEDFKSPEAAISQIAKKYNISSFTVPQNFPLGLAQKLKDLKLEVPPGPLFPNRLIKSEQEAKFIQEANKAAAAGIKAAEDALKKSIIKKNRLYLNGKILTSEYLKTLVNSAALNAGATAQNTIVAAGNQACDPHCQGSGPIPPHQLIIVDVFPRNSKSYYHGDMTRTFLKGTPSDAQAHLINTVKKAQKDAIKKIKSNITANTIHNSINEFFIQKGYKTEKINDTHQGFIHSTGHGLGLDIHEEPRVSTANNKLKSGTVITIEPGLYYPNLGACRIEDVIQVLPNGHKLLSKYHYSWHIP